MKGGFVIATDPALFERAAQALLALGGARAVDLDGDGAVQFSDADDRLFTLFEHVPANTEWEVRDGPFVAAPRVKLPDMRTVIACPFECRWPDIAARIADAIAATSEDPTWLLDGDGVVWDARAVDQGAVRL